MPEAKDPIMSPNTLDDTIPPETDIPPKAPQLFFTEPAETLEERKPPEPSNDASKTTKKQ